MKETIKLTKERYDKLKEELAWLKTTRQDEVAEMIKVARSFGDLSENSEYDEAKDQQNKMYARIAEIEDMLPRVEIIKETKRSSKVDAGRKVKIRNVEDGTEKEYHIVGSQEANPMKGLLSDVSPIGKALVGHKVGDQVEIENARGILKFEIIEIH